MRTKAGQHSQAKLAEYIKAAQGKSKVDLVLKNAEFLDVFSGNFVKADIAITDQIIVGTFDNYVAKEVIDASGCYIVPGFIDAHVHIESSLMEPARFQEAVMPCGTTTAIWDPHEIANVKGTKGIEWAIESAKVLDIDVFVMVPSCVPSTSAAFELETSGASLTAPDIAPFAGQPGVLGLAEMMNFPGLLAGDDDIMRKLHDFRAGLRDGHCPGLSGKDLNAYAVAGIHSCHESTTLYEAREKLAKGIHVLIREGSCAKDAHTLLPIIEPRNATNLALCSDDRNPLDIKEEGHINFTINMGLAKGQAPEDLFRAASFGPSRLYGLFDRGAIAPGYLADFVVLRKNAVDWRSGVSIQAVYKKGRKVDAQKLAQVPKGPSHLLGEGANLNLDPITNLSLEIKAPGRRARAQVIEVIPQQILTNHIEIDFEITDGTIHSDVERDVLKIAVYERHHRTGRFSVGLVKGFGIKSGAIATSINHDSHNVIVVGSDDSAMVRAVSELIRIDGGIVVTSLSGQSAALELPIGGLMTDKSPAYVASKLSELKHLAKGIGCVLQEPFLQLSFLALPVIPKLKITDRGLVDVTVFQKIPLLKDI